MNLNYDRWKRLNENFALGFKTPDMLSTMPGTIKKKVVGAGEDNKDNDEETDDEDDKPSVCKDCEKEGKKKCSCSKKKHKQDKEDVDLDDGEDPKKPESNKDKKMARGERVKVKDDDKLTFPECVRFPTNLPMDTASETYKNLFAESLKGFGQWHPPVVPVKTEDFLIPPPAEQSYDDFDYDKVDFNAHVNQDVPIKDWEKEFTQIAFENFIQENNLMPEFERWRANKKYKKM